MFPMCRELIDAAPNRYSVSENICEAYPSDSEVMQPLQ